YCKDPWPATIRGISTGGLSLTLGRRFEHGSGLAIEIPTEDGATSIVLARVVRVSTHPDGGWLLGCSFISELSEEEVRHVLNLHPLNSATLTDGDAPAAPGSALISGVLFQARLRHGEVLRWFVKRLQASRSWPLPRGKD